MGSAEDAVLMLEELLEDRGIPRNIKNAIEKSIQEINTSKESDDVKISSVIAMLDESSNDPNLSLHARTRMWNTASRLEGLNC